MEKEYEAELIAALELAGDKRVANGVRNAAQRGGVEAIAQWQLDDLKNAQKTRYISPLRFARAYARAHQKEEALKNLEAAFRERVPFLIFLQNDVDFDFLHSDPRYRALVLQMGLPPAF